MSEQEIIEGNKLIAEFIGYKFNGNIVISAPLDKNGFDNYDILTGYNISQAAYNSSWNWLMSVVEKIDNLNISNLNLEESSCVHAEIAGSHIKISIRHNHTGMEDYHFLYFENDYTDENSKILAVYKAVIEFIKWYNKQK